MSEKLHTNNLFKKILIEPVSDASELYIVSGYASSAMVFHHATKLKELDLKIKINLLIGMTSEDGLSYTNHKGFQKLMNDDFSSFFTCSYLTDCPPVHSKVYTWINGTKPVKAFSGSPNYSQKAFVGNHQREVANECDPSMAYEYYNSLIDESIYCNHLEAEELINLYKAQKPDKSKSSLMEETGFSYDSALGLEKVTISFINKYGVISKRSALNWGKRKGREPNQGYIPLRSNVYKTNFFPPRSQHFTVHTDDGKILICSRAQENGKAIHTPHNNSLIGEYFRYRLGVPNGELVTMDHFLKYGRTDLEFYKIDEENYHMDFSVK
ncbi:MAG: NgoFVII family restriction endonuclease [Proteobacteria bacterium]|nr:MAG: NgoFVII family restriction endonuclease [Pseudomonadota bacterium]